MYQGSYSKVVSVWYAANYVKMNVGKFIQFLQKSAIIMSFSDLKKCFSFDVLAHILHVGLLLLRTKRCSQSQSG